VFQRISLLALAIPYPYAPTTLFQHTNGISKHRTARHPECKAATSATD